MAYEVFKYQGSYRNGIKRKGVIVAPTKADALRLLRGRGIYVSRISKIPDYIVSFYRAKPSEIALVFNGLSKMKRAGIDFQRAIENLIGEQISPAITIALYKMLESAKEGHPIPYVFKASGLFGEDIIAIIEAGALSGSLEDVFDNLEDYYEQKNKIKKAIYKAAAYPIAVITLAFFALVFIAPKIIEPMKATFEYIGAGHLPKITVIVMDVVYFLERYFVLIALGIVVGVKLFIDWYRRNKNVKRRVDHLMTRLPIYGEFIERLSIFRFILTLSLLQRAGIPIAEALKIATQTVTNDTIRSDYEDVVRKVSEGDSLTKAMRYSYYIPDIAKSFISIGEETGKLEEQLHSLKEFTKESFSEYVERFKAIMTPVSVVILGVIIAIMLVAIYLPMFNLIDLAKG